MLSLKEYEQLVVAIQTMTAPIRHDNQILIPRDYVLRLLKTFTVEVE